MDPRDDMPNVRQYYNNRPFVGKATPQGADTFGIGKDDPSGEGIVPQIYVNKGAAKLISASFELIISIFADINKKGIPEEDRVRKLKEADDALRKIDTFSTRSWLKVFGIHPDWIDDAGKIKQDKLLEIPTLDKLLEVMYAPNSDFGYPPAVIQWIETTQTGTTGWYDMALTQTLMELADFGDQALGHDSWRPDPPAARDYDWVCVDGGSEDIAKGMLASIGADKVQVKKRVTAVLKDKDGLSVLVASEQEPKSYNQVICTATLGCMATMDLDECTSYVQRVAIRCLQYDASCKIGVQFSTRWWQDASFMQGKPIYGGVSKSDLPLSNVVYPSYGPEEGAPGVLICSYTWAQDARVSLPLPLFVCTLIRKRLGALIGQGGEMSQELRDLVVRDLAKIHALPQSSPNAMRAEVRRLEKEIGSRITNSFAFAWYNDPNYRGAFAIFGPSQFYDTAPPDELGSGGASLFDSVKVPGAGGTFHIAGEATSTHHGWIIGALNSAWRAVNNVIKGCSDEHALRKRLTRRFEDGGWETPDEEPEQAVTNVGYDIGRSGGW